MVNLISVSEIEIEAAAPAEPYTRESLGQTLSFMGCKQRHAFKVSQRVFDTLALIGGPAPARVQSQLRGRFPRGQLRGAIFKGDTAFLTRSQLFAIVAWALAEYRYTKPDQMDDLAIACRVRERRSPVVVLLCGTSGTGKSTLAALLAGRMGITTVLSTDSVRHLMRGFQSREEAPILHASTYEAGAFMPPVLVEGSPPDPEALAAAERKRIVRGYKTQCDLIGSHLSQLLSSLVAANESVIVEGVHLSPRVVLALMQKIPNAVPFLVVISNEAKHLERFAVRAKRMSLSPEGNRYTKNFKNIRTIQDYLAHRCGHMAVPKVNNTNVDRSLDAIHATVFGCLRRALAGQALWDAEARRTAAALEEFQRQQQSRGAWSSKSMLEVIKVRREMELAVTSDNPSTSSSAVGDRTSDDDRDQIVASALRGGRGSDGHLSSDEAPEAAGEGGAAGEDSDDDAEGCGSVYESHVSEDDFPGYGGYPFGFGAGGRGGAGPLGQLAGGGGERSPLRAAWGGAANGGGGGGADGSGGVADDEGGDVDGDGPPNGHGGRRGGGGGAGPSSASNGWSHHHLSQAQSQSTASAMALRARVLEATARFAASSLAPLSESPEELAPACS